MVLHSCSGTSGSQFLGFTQCLKVHMAISSFRPHDYQKVRQYDTHPFSDAETEYEAAWNTESFYWNPDGSLKEQFLKVEGDDEDISPSWFHLLAALVICYNMVSIVLEAGSTSEALLAKIYWVDQGSLSWSLFVAPPFGRVGSLWA